MPTVEAVLTHPVKSLDPMPVESADLVGGRLRHDREYALQDDDRELVNATREPALHRVRSSYDPGTRTLTVREQGDPESAAESFALDSERGDANAWFSEFLGYPVALVRDAGGGFVDRAYAKGPSVIATGTLETIGDWFDLDPADVRRRFRANLVVDAEPFWGDRLWAGAASSRAGTPTPASDSTTSSGGSSSAARRRSPSGRPPSASSTTTR